MLKRSIQTMLGYIDECINGCIDSGDCVCVDSISEKGGLESKLGSGFVFGSGLMFVVNAITNIIVEYKDDTLASEGNGIPAITGTLTLLETNKSNVSDLLPRPAWFKQRPTKVAKVTHYSGINEANTIAPTAMFISLGYGSNAKTLVFYSDVIKTKSYYDNRRSMTIAYLSMLMSQYNDDLSRDFYESMCILNK